MKKAMRRFFITLVVLLVLLGGAGWWLRSYIAPAEQLDMSYTPISLKEKAWEIIKNRKTELVLSEADVNFLIKSAMAFQLSDGEAAAGREGLWLDQDLRLDGAAFQLEQDMLLARMNVTWKDYIPAELNASYRLEWQQNRIALRPQSLALKGIALPTGLLETVLLPLELPEQDYVSISDITFEPDQIRILFKIDLKLPF